MTAGTIKDYIGYGTVAARPVSPAVTAVSGGSARYYATDTNTEYCWDGSAWQPVGGTAAAFTKIGTQTPTTGTCTFSSIPSTYNALRLILSGRSDAAVTGAGLTLQFNADTGTNYDWARYYFVSGAAGNGEGGGVSSIDASGVPGASATANAGGIVIIDIPLYAQTTFWKQCKIDAMFFNGTHTDFRMQGGNWRSTAAINSIVLTLSSGNFVSGSEAILYGLA